MATSSKPPHSSNMGNDTVPPVTERVPVLERQAHDCDNEQTGVTEKWDAQPHAAPRDQAILTVLKGPKAGRVVVIAKEATLIGRSRSADIHIDDVRVSGFHARILRWLDGSCSVEDLGSSNATYVNAKKVEERVRLESGDQLQLGSDVLLRFTMADAVETALQRNLYEGSTRDALTHLFNRAYMSRQLVRELAFARRHDTDVSLIMLDLDHFKAVNDKYGHPAGDEVLREIAVRLGELCRIEDVVARYGGEEFVLLLRGITREGAAAMADRIRVAIVSHPFKVGGDDITVTVSQGAVALSELRGEAGADELIALADERMYQAKSQGRDRVCSSQG